MYEKKNQFILCNPFVLQDDSLQMIITIPFKTDYPKSLVVGFFLVKRKLSLKKT